MSQFHPKGGYLGRFPLGLIVLDILVYAVSGLSLSAISGMFKEMSTEDYKMVSLRELDQS